jgi:hypothetical protein
VLNRLNMTLEESELFLQRANEQLSASQTLFQLK